MQQPNLPIERYSNANFALRLESAPCNSHLMLFRLHLTTRPGRVPFPGFAHSIAARFAT